MTLHLIKTKKYDDNNFVAMGLFFLVSKAFPLFHRKFKLCSKVIIEYVSINVFEISNIAGSNLSLSIIKDVPSFRPSA